MQVLIQFIAKNIVPINLIFMLNDCVWMLHQPRKFKFGRQTKQRTYLQSTKVIHKTTLLYSTNYLLLFYMFSIITGTVDPKQVYNDYFELFENNFVLFLFLFLFTLKESIFF